LKTVLSIAGYDPSSGAGVTADLMVFAAHGLFGTSCITALTVQSTVGVRSVNPVSANLVAETLACLEQDLPPAGIKIGMLATSDNVQAVLNYVERLRDGGRVVPIVLDPVVRSSSGSALLDKPGIQLLRAGLLGAVDWITPNIAELELLSGILVHSSEDVPKACRALQEQIASAAGRRPGILAKGGHMQKPDDYLLEQWGREVWLGGERVETKSTHGTGCALSSAFLSQMVIGRGPEDAARRAKAYVTGALRAAVPMGAGAGPLNHLWESVKVQDAG